VEEEENQPEENGFSNRHVSTTFIPPLTVALVALVILYFFMSETRDQQFLKANK
jgi:hypothetical protein